MVSISQLFISNAYADGAAAAAPQDGGIMQFLPLVAGLLRSMKGLPQSATNQGL